MKRIAVIPGDGIGPEVITEAVRTVELATDVFDLELSLDWFDWGAEKYLSTGVTLPEGALEMLATEYDAILSGAFGDPQKVLRGLSPLRSSTLANTGARE